MYTSPSTNITCVINKSNFHEISLSDKNTLSLSLRGDKPLNIIYSIYLIYTFCRLAILVISNKDQLPNNPESII